MNEISEFLYRENWTFAKTYADRAPHEYIVRGKITGTDREFEDAARYIREKGIPMKFWGETYRYLNLDGRLYWTMGEPVEETIIINRCELEDIEINITSRVGKMSGMVL